MSKSRITDVLVVAFVAVWIAYTFSAIRRHGPDPYLIGGAMVIGILGTLMVYGHRIDYLQVGDTLVVGLETRHDRKHPNRESDSDEQRERFR